jgi:hypothetical protein
MTKKDVILSHEPIAYASACGGIEIYHIENGINDFIYFTSNAWNGTPRNKPHKAKIKYTLKGSPFFMCEGYRISLDDCIRWGL